MSHSTTKPISPIEKWSKEDVHLWLMTEVKVHETCADRFSEEEVSGDSLVVFEKTDILDLGIKHGPAVKIISYLERLKGGSQHESQFPAYVKNWTKEQVNQWALEHLNLYSKYAEKLQEEDVSGDCLVCFQKQDFLDLGVKSGPAVKILKGLRDLNNKPEPKLQPILHTSTDEEPAPNLAQPELSQALPKTTMQQESRDTTETKTDKMVEKKSEEVPPQFKKASEEKKIQQPEPQSMGARGKETAVVKIPPNTPNITVEILKTLDNLRKDDLKSFHFNLREYTESAYEPIRLSKLENADTKDTANLLTNHYGATEALRVTKDVLTEINQRELVRQLEENLGKSGPTSYTTLSQLQ